MLTAACGMVPKRDEHFQPNLAAVGLLAMGLVVLLELGMHVRVGGFRSPPGLLLSRGDHLRVPMIALAIVPPVVHLLVDELLPGPVDNAVPAQIEIRRVRILRNSDVNVL